MILLPLRQLTIVFVLATTLAFRAHAGESVAESSALTVDLRSESFKAWLAAYYDEVQIQDRTVTDANTDTDGDGNNNFLEFLAKVDPTDHLQRYRIYLSGENKDTLVVGPISPLANHQVEYSTYLKIWLPVDSRFQQTQGDEIHIDVSSFKPGTFFRAKISE